MPIRNAGSKPLIASGCWRSSCRVRDPLDQMFLYLTLAPAVTTHVLDGGDADLLAPKPEFVPLQIINPADFQSWLTTNPLA